MWRTDMISGHRFQAIVLIRGWALINFFCRQVGPLIRGWALTRINIWYVEGVTYFVLRYLTTFFIGRVIIKSPVCEVYSTL